MTHKMALRNIIDFHLFLQNHDLDVTYDESQTNLTTLLLFPFLKKYNEPRFVDVKSKFIKLFYKKYVGLEGDYCTNNYYNCVLSAILKINYDHLPLKVIRDFEQYQKQNNDNDINIDVISVDTYDYRKYIRNNTCNSNDFFDLVFTLKPDVRLTINDVANVNVPQFLNMHYPEIYKEDYHVKDSAYHTYIYQLSYHFAALHNILNCYRAALRNHVKLNSTSQLKQRENKKRLMETDVHVEEVQANQNKRLKYNNESGEVEMKQVNVGMYGSDMSPLPQHPSPYASIYKPYSNSPLPPPPIPSSSSSSSSFRTPPPPPLPPRASSLAKPTGNTVSYYHRLNREKDEGMYNPSRLTHAHSMR